MTDRDTFAAAALTGLLANGSGLIAANGLNQWRAIGNGYRHEDVAATSYELADAMLRERERTNHDAVPEARAKPSSTGHAATLDTAVVAGLQRESVGTGNTQEPIGWIVSAVETGEQWFCFGKPSVTSNYARTVTPLYRSPALTDEEREAIEIAAAVLDDEYYGTNCKKELAAVATLRELLERMK
jgi:hypothetical protein